MFALFGTTCVTKFSGEKGKLKPVPDWSVLKTLPRPLCRRITDHFQRLGALVSALVFSFEGQSCIQVTTS